MYVKWQSRQSLSIQNKDSIFDIDSSKVSEKKGRGRSTIMIDLDDEEMEKEEEMK
jgi:hypothetical protein